MKDAGILSGDLVVCEPRQYAENGEIVAVLIQGEEATVKQFMPEAGRVRLLPANDAYQPIVVAPDTEDFSIAGKVVGLVRRY